MLVDGLLQRVDTPAGAGDDWPLQTLGEAGGKLLPEPQPLDVRRVVLPPCAKSMLGQPAYRQRWEELPWLQQHWTQSAMVLGEL